MDMSSPPIGYTGNRRLQQLDIASLERLAAGEPVLLPGLSICDGALPPPLVAGRRLAQHHDGVAPLWCLPFLVIEADLHVVAACGFKGAPVARRVEVGYGVAPAWRRRGIAHATLLQVLQMVRGSDEVDAVLAYTAPDNPASMKVLARAGFDRGGEVIDPYGETVVEWVRELAR